MLHKASQPSLNSSNVQATQQGLQQVAVFDTKDGLYDCAWSEVICYAIPPSSAANLSASEAVQHFRKMKTY